MSTLRQTLEVTAINLRNIPHRIGSSLVICMAIAGVVAVLTTVLAMASGLRIAYSGTARPDRVVVLASGARTEAISMLSRDDIALIETGPGIRRTAAGKPAVSPELLLPVALPRAGETGKAKAGKGTVTVRGVTPLAADVRPEVQLTAGRMFATGVREIIVGSSAHNQFAHLDIGDTARFYNGDWKVVGLFTSDGDVHESEVMADAATLMSAARRTAFNAATVALEAPSAFDAFKQALLRDPVLKIDVQRETEYRGRQSEQAGRVVEIVATTIGAIMAIGAVCGALNAMYSAVSARAVEIATLRAIGFGATPVVVSVLIESQLLALIGGVAGGAIAWLLFNGGAFATGDAFGQIAGHLHIGTSLIAAGMAWAVVIGLLGGLFPAIHAARMSVVDALRAV